VIVADVGSFYAAGAGGIRTYYQAKARGLPARGIEHHVVVPGARATTERIGDAWLHRIPGPALDAHYRCFADVPRLRRLLRELRPDVVELGSHYLLPQLLSGLRTAFVGFYHADFPQTYAPRRLREAAWWLVRHQHARYRATLAGSREVAGSLASHGVPRVRWVGLGVDIDTFRPPGGRERARRFGYLGRLAADKELDVLLAAAPRILFETGARVAIAGEGPLAPAVRAAARRGEVEMLGLLSPAESADFLASLDVLIVPGRHESFGLAAAEALACATPVLAADRGGACELVTGAGAGATFRAGDATALAVAAIDLLRARDLRLRGARGRRFVESTYSWDHVLDRIHTVYREVAC
jgi:glycosyltransferase involved in cell wall biosynthesis